MTNSTLKFVVTGDASQGASALRRMLSPLQQLKRQSTETKTALGQLSRTKANVQVEDKAITRAKDEIKRLRDEIARKLEADVTADTRQAERRIRQLESSIRQLGKRTTITPQVNTTQLGRLRSMAGSALASVKSGVQSIGAGLSRVASSVGVPVIGAIGVAAAGAATGVGLLALKSLTLADHLDNAKIAFTQFLGSAGKADTFLARLRSLAATTPFEFPELVESSKRLLAFGVKGKDVVGIMTSLGDAAALTGNSVDDLATIYGQMVAKGRIQNEELLQLTERGIPAYQILADKLGLSVAEVTKLASEGKLGAKALTALQTGIDEKFGGGMVKQAKTLGGLISTLKDTLTGTLTNIGTAVLPIAKAVFPLIQSGAESMGSRIKALMPTVVDTIAGGLQQLLSLPGTLLRGLGSVTQGIAGMVSGIQGSVASLVDGIATALAGIPGISEADVSGLRTAATDLRAAAQQTDQAGAAGMNKLNAAAAAADRAVSPIKTKLEQARQAANQQMKLDLQVQDFDTKIADVNAKIKTLKEQRASATLDADKRYFDQKIAAAEKQKKSLKEQKATAVIDAKIDGLRAKVVSAKSQLNALKAQKPTPEIRAKINDLEAKVRKGKAQLADLNKQRPTPRADLSTAALNREARAATAKVKAVDRMQAHPNVGLKWAGGMTPSSVQRQINSITGREVYVTVKRRGGGPTVDGLSLPSSAISLSAPAPEIRIEPQITIAVQDEKLADLISVIVDGKAAQAAKVVGRRQVIHA